MSARPLALAVLLTAILVLPVCSLVGHGPPRASSPAMTAGPHPLGLGASGNAQLTSTATELLKRTQKFWQNSSSIYATASIPVTFPTNFTTANYSSISTFVETFTPTAPGNLYPQVNQTQGTALVANTTATIPYTVAPTFSATAVTQKVVELFTATGALPSNGVYTVTTLALQTIAFSLNTAINWSANQSAFYQASYLLSAPKGYWLNQSQVFVPFPSLATGVNWSTVSVLLNGTAYKNFQVVTGGVYVSVISVVPGTSASVTVRFTASPALSGAAPTVTVSTWSVVNATTNQLNASWTNQMSVAYAGEFLIQTNFPYAIDPTSLVVDAGQHPLYPGSWTIAGNTIQILPLIVTVASGSAVTFFVSFRFIGAPPSFHLSAATVAFGSGTGAVSWGELALAGWVLFGIASATAFLVSWNPAPERNPRAARLLAGRTRLRLAWDERHRIVVTTAVVAVFLFAVWVYLVSQAGGLNWL